MLIKSLAVFLIAAFFIGWAESAKLPSYIPPCSQSSPDLNQCFVDNGNAAIPRLVKGDKKFKIPKLDPLSIPRVSLENAGNLDVTLTDCTISGLGAAKISKSRVNLSKRHISISVKVPYLNIISQYSIRGRILVLPVSGNGPANITFVGGDFTYNFQFDLVNRDNTEYLKLKDDELILKVDRAYYDLENLFDGNALLSTETNSFLNDNWEAITNDLGPAISETVKTVATSIIKNILDVVPYSAFLTP